MQSKKKKNVTKGNVFNKEYKVSCLMYKLPHSLDEYARVLKHK